MSEQELFREMAENYWVCFNGACPSRESCLRWRVGEQVSPRQRAVTAVNPHLLEEGAARCALFVEAKRQTMPVGLLSTFDDMPYPKAIAVRKALRAELGNTMYYKYRNGERPITPQVAEVIERVVKELGWNKPLAYDGTVDDYPWF